MTSQAQFTTLGRQQFRRYFQPSRIVLGILPAPTPSGVNVITLCFDMHCSYKPPKMAIAIQNIAASFDLANKAKEYVLAVPGPSLAEATVFCGVNSMHQVDKVSHLGLTLCPSETVSVPGLENAIANIELVKENCIDVGDHRIVIGRVLRFAVNRTRRELPLLSVGPDTAGYRVLSQKGIHRIAVVAADSGFIAKAKTLRRTSERR